MGINSTVTTDLKYSIHSSLHHIHHPRNKFAQKLEILKRVINNFKKSEKN